VATSFNNLAELYRTQGRYSEAEPLYQQALVLWQNLLGDEHPSVAQGFNNLALLCSGALQPSGAAVSTSPGVVARLVGDGHPDVAQGFNNLGVLHGRYDSATCLERALAYGCACWGLTILTHKALNEI
jgi:tetratricopeptide (TPR) repeat protein